MQVTLLIFGQLVDIMGSKSVVVSNIPDTETLKEVLQQTYPRLKAIPYLIAVEKEVVLTNTGLFNNAMVALLPPFAGG